MFTQQLLPFFAKSPERRLALYVTMCPNIWCAHGNQSFRWTKLISGSRFCRLKINVDLALHSHLPMLSKGSYNASAIRVTRTP